MAAAVAARHLTSEGQKNYISEQLAFVSARTKGQRTERASYVSERPPRYIHGSPPPPRPPSIHPWPVNAVASIVRDR